MELYRLICENRCRSDWSGGDWKQQIFMTFMGMIGSEFILFDPATGVINATTKLLEIGTIDNLTGIAAISNWDL